MFLTALTHVSTGEASTLIVSDPYFASVEAAVKAASDMYNPVSIREDREFIGAILSHDGKFYYSVTAGDKGKDEITLRIPGNRWERVVALWHTHGGHSNQFRFFSDYDTAIVNTYGLDLYLADYTGSLRVFRPGDATMSLFKASRNGLPTQGGFAEGTTVVDADNKSVRIKTS